MADNEFGIIDTCVGHTPNSGLSRPGSSPGWGHCAAFLGKTRYSHSYSLHPDVEMGTGELKAWSNPAMDYHPVQRGRRSTSSRFMLLKPELNVGLVGHLGAPCVEKLLSDTLRLIIRRNDMARHTLGSYAYFIYLTQ